MSFFIKPDLQRGPESPSIVSTLLMAAVLLLAPQLLLGVLFGLYAQMVQIENAVAWFSLVEVQLTLMFLALPISGGLVIVFTHQFGTQNRNWFVILEYLHIKPCTVQEITHWLCLSFFFWLSITLLGVVTEVPEEAFMLNIRDSATSPFIVMTVICIFAPIVEEMIFRGFIFQRFRQTWLANSGAAIMTCLLFTAIHGAQYTLSGLFVIFLIAAYLTFIRLKTQNTTLCILAHATNNCLSMIALYAFV